MKRIATAALILTALSVPTSAQWFYQVKESAFDDKKIQIMGTAKGGYVFGIRCTNGKKEIVYLTTEKIKDTSNFSTVVPKIKLRIDNNNVHEFDAVVNATNGKLGVTTVVNKALLAEIRDAKTRIAVVLQFFGQKFHENTFNVRGSTSAAKKLISACR